MDDLLAVNQRKTFGRTREDDVAQTELAHRVACRLFNRKILVCNRFEQNLIDLLDVRGEVVCILVLRPLCPLWVNDDGYAMIVRRADDVLTRELRTRALAIVRDDNAVHALVELLVNVGKILLCIVAVNRAGILKVKAEHLLMPSDDADFCRGRAIGTDQSCMIDAARSKFLKQTLAVRIVADIACDADIRPEKRKVMRHVRRTAKGLARPRHMGDRHRSLGGDTRDLTRVILIEHDITDDEDVAAHTLLRDRCADLCHIHENSPIIEIIEPCQSNPCALMPSGRTGRTNRSAAPFGVRTNAPSICSTTRVSKSFGRAISYAGLSAFSVSI